MEWNSRIVNSRSFLSGNEFSSAAVEGEEHGDHHHEKESVLKKVKAKAKKLKDKIAKHGHGHDHDNRQEGHVGPDDHSLDEEDDEDEEMVEDPEVHGAPSELLCTEPYESAVVLVSLLITAIEI